MAGESPELSAQARVIEEIAGLAVQQGQKLGVDLRLRLQRVFECDLMLSKRLDRELCGEAIGCHLADAVLLQQVGALLNDNLWRERGLELPDHVERGDAILNVA